MMLAQIRAVGLWRNAYEVLLKWQSDLPFFVPSCFGSAMSWCCHSRPAPLDRPMVRRLWPTTPTRQWPNHGPGLARMSLSRSSKSSQHLQVMNLPEPKLYFGHIFLSPPYFRETGRGEKKRSGVGRDCICIFRARHYVGREGRLCSDSNTG